MIDLRIAAGLLLVAFFSGVWSGHKMADSDIKTMQLQHTQAINDMLNKHAIRVAELRKINDETTDKLNQQAADTAVTVATGDSLQQQFTASLCKPVATSVTASTITDSAADATTRLVHSYVFEVVNRRAIAYAAIADESRLRGLACEAEYEAAVRF